MLILSRNTGDAIIISNNITVTVLGVRGHQVRLGIDAPREIPVDREEIWQKKQGKNVKPVKVLGGRQREKKQ